MQAGGTLELWMGPAAAPEWGSVLPPSFGGAPSAECDPAVSQAREASFRACGRQEEAVATQPVAAPGADALAVTLAAVLAAAVAGLLVLAAGVALMRRSQRRALPLIAMSTLPSDAPPKPRAGQAATADAYDV